MSFVTEEEVARLSYGERKMALLSQIWSAITTVREPRITAEIIKLLDIAFPVPAAPEPASNNVVAFPHA